MVLVKFHLGVERERVDRRIDLLTPCMGIRYPLSVGIHIELFARTDTQREGTGTTIDGIGTVVQCDLHLFQVPCRC